MKRGGKANARVCGDAEAPATDAKHQKPWASSVRRTAAVGLLVALGLCFLFFSWGRHETSLPEGQDEPVIRPEGSNRKTAPAPSPPLGERQTSRGLQLEGQTRPRNSPAPAPPIPEKQARKGTALPTPEKQARKKTLRLKTKEWPDWNQAGAKRIAEEQALESQVQFLDKEVRKLKATGIIMEANEAAKNLTGQLQAATRLLLLSRYGPEPYRIELELKFPASMPPDPIAGTRGRLVFQMAPMELMPHAVFSFLEIVRTFKGGSFHRVAGHVLQAQVNTGVKHLAFQEYSPKFPHVRGSVGYCGRPSGPGFYISTVDNTRNHGPGSQQHKNPYEADACFGTVIEGYDEMVPRIQRQPGVQPPAGWVSPPSNYIQIVTAKLQRHEQDVATEKNQEEVLDAEVQELDARVRAIKATGVIMETDAEALQAIQKLQDATRRLLEVRYGKEPYRVKLKLRFPDSMPPDPVSGSDGTLVFEMAPSALMPHAVFTFLELARTWQGGAFHRVAPHVLQAKPLSTNINSLAFQEYSAEFPHIIGSVGYAGRPSGPEFYISIEDNTVNHGPGSQQEENPYEADACFAKVIEGFKDVVPRLKLQPGATAPNGFVEDSSYYIMIRDVSLVSGAESDTAGVRTF